MRFANYMSFAADVNQHGLEYAAERSARLGFDAVEFLADHAAKKPFADLSEVKAAKQILDHHGLSVACYSIGWNLYECEIDDLMRHAEYAHAVGSPMIHHTLLPVLSLTEESPQYEDVFETVLQAAERMAEYCDTLGLTCLYEPQGMYFNGIDGLGRFFDAMKKKYGNIGICGDTATSLFVDVDPLEIFKHFSKDIKHLHVHNYAVFDTETIFRSRSGRWLDDVKLTEGIVDLKACFEQIKGYDGIISLEMVADDETLKNAMDHIKTIF